MNAKLKVVGGTHAGKLIPLAGPTFIVGRGEECHLRAGSDSISRQHCAFSIGSAGITLKDFGSRNGTHVNGVRITAEQEIKSGDLLKIGPLEFELVLEYGDKPKKKPPVKDLADIAARTAATGIAKTVGDEEITSWLGDPDPPTTGRWSGGAAETQAVQLSGDTAVDPVPAQPQKPTQPGGKLPKIEPPKSKDSREAAVNILKTLAKRAAPRVLVNANKSAGTR